MLHRAEYRLRGKGDYTTIDRYRINTLKRALDKEANIQTSTDNLYSIIESDFSPRINPVQDYLRALPLSNGNAEAITALADCVRVNNSEKREEYKELLKETKQKQLEDEELILKVRELEKQAGKLRVKGTLYSLFGNSEKEKAEIRKEVIILQDTIRDKDKTISEQQREIKVYEEERSFIKRFFHSFHLLLNIRLMLRKMGFDDRADAL